MRPHLLRHIIEVCAKDAAPQNGLHSLVRQAGFAYQAKKEAGPFTTFTYNVDKAKAQKAISALNSSLLRGKFPASSKSDDGAIVWSKPGHKFTYKAGVLTYRVMDMDAQARAQRMAMQRTTAAASPDEFHKALVARVAKHYKVHARALKDEHRLHPHSQRFPHNHFINPRNPSKHPQIPSISLTGDGNMYTMQVYTGNAPNIIASATLRGVKPVWKQIQTVLKAHDRDYKRAAPHHVKAEADEPAIGVMAREVMWQIFDEGTTWDGNLVSKNGRDELIEGGYAQKVEGWNFLTEKGMKAAVALGMDKRKDAKDQQRIAQRLVKKQQDADMSVLAMGVRKAGDHKMVVKRVNVGIYDVSYRGMEFELEQSEAYAGASREWQVVQRLSEFKKEYWEHYRTKNAALQAIQEGVDSIISAREFKESGQDINKTPQVIEVLKIVRNGGDFPRALVDVLRKYKGRPGPQPAYEDVAAAVSKLLKAGK